MIGDVSLRAPALHRSTVAPRPVATGKIGRRVVEVLVSVLAFAVWGVLAYKGFFRMLARAEGVSLGGHWLLDVLSLLVGVSGSIAGVSAIWAMLMRAMGRTPASLVGAPDDSPEDRPHRADEPRLR